MDQNVNKKHWYIKKSGVTYGPVSIQELKALVKKQRIGKNDFVRKKNSKKWVAINNVKFLNCSTTENNTENNKNYTFQDISNKIDSYSGTKAEKCSKIIRDNELWEAISKLNVIDKTKIKIILTSAKFINELNFNIILSSYENPINETPINETPINETPINIPTSRFLAIILSLLIPGAGQLYKHQMRGILWFIVIVALYGNNVFLGLITHLFCVVGAGSSVQNISMKNIEHKKITKTEMRQFSANLRRISRVMKSIGRR